MEVIIKEKAKKIVEQALNEAYNSVAHTLGPKGTNAVIVLDGKTTITNDGVSIIKQLKFDDDIYNIPLDIIKEACFSSENKSGDGTTTSIVLTKGIFDKGKTLIEKGMSPINVRELFLKQADDYVMLINSAKKNIESSSEIKGVATVSIGGDEKLGEIVSQAFSEVNFSGQINYQIDPLLEDIKLEKTNGYNIPTKYLGYDKLPKELSEATVLIYEGTISNTIDLRNIAEFNRENNLKPLILFSNFESDAINGIFNYSNAGNKIYPYSLPKFGKDRETFLTEIRFLTNAAKIDKDIPIINYEVEDIESAVGEIKNCILKSDNLLITSLDETKLNMLLSDLENRDEIRYTELKNGLCTILIGGKTEVEAEETLLRIQDAVNSVRLAIKSGIVIGGANILHNLSVLQQNELSSALELPLKLIIENNFRDYNEIIEEINKCKYNYGYNAKTDKVEDLLKAGVIDPAETVINSLKSAVSIATSLLTINCIIKENKKQYGGF